MDKLFQSKWFIRVISLVLALTLYLFVTVENDVTKNDSRIEPNNTKEVQVLEDVPLEIKIDADNYVVSGVPEHVTVSLEGKTSVLTPLVRQRNFNVFVDLTDLDAGEHVVDVEYENLPREVNAYIEPKSIDVQIEKRAMQEYSIDVDIVNQDKLPPGYEIGEPELSPNVVTVVSSEEIINQIAMVKVFLDVTDVKESIRNKELPIVVYDAQGNDLSVRIEPETAIVSLDVDRPSKKVSLEAVTKGKLPENLSLDEIELPEDIDVFGRRDLLNELDEIATAPFDLSEVDKSGEYEFTLDLPDGVVANEETITGKITLNESKVLKDIPIDVEGLGDYEISLVHPSDEKVSITAVGTDTAMKELKKDDLKAVIDVTGLEVDEHRLNIEVTGPKGFKYDAEPKKITVDIKEES